MAHPWRGQGYTCPEARGGGHGRDERVCKRAHGCTHTAAEGFDVSVPLTWGAVSLGGEGSPNPL